MRMFVRLRPRLQKWNEKDEEVCPVASWYDSRGSRYFLVRRSSEAGKYDVKVVVEQEVRANRSAVTIKQVILAARALAIELTEREIEQLTASTAAR
jgi:hypothetical protein